MIHVDIDKAQLAEFCRRWQIRELSVFGSVLREDFSPGSDVDVLVEFEPEAQIGFLTLAKAARELSSLFGRKVDLIPKNGLKPRLRGHVLAAAEVLFAT